LSEQSYPTAKLVAPTIHAHFAKHLAAARARGRDPIAALPSAEVIERMINATFWASLRREEGYVPKISMAFLPPEHTEHPMMLEQPVALAAQALTKVAAIVEHAGIHLGVWEVNGELCIWGTAHNIPTFCFVLEVVEPGLIVVKHHRGEKSGKYVNVAVLEGDQIKIVDENASSLPDCPDLVTSLLGFDSPASWVDSVNVLVQLAVSMRSHGRGGSLLIVPPNSDAWRESIVHPIRYAVSPPFREMAELMRETGEGRQAEVWKDALRETVEAIAGLTAVDGAAILTDQYELLAFGAKIQRRRGAEPVESVMVTEPVEGGAPTMSNASQLGGTRHLSAAQFVHDQRNAIALVASQDRRFTVFAWSPCEESVHAHRVEVLLL
jgi:Probable sensor domain DACNV